MKSSQEMQKLNLLETKAVKTKTAKVKAVKVTAEVAPPVIVAAKLPATGAELWLKCVGSKKVTVAQITDAALKKLKLDDSARAVIATRAKAWAYTAVKKGDLIEAGMRDGSKLFQLAPAKSESPTPSVQAAESVDAEVAVAVTPVAAASDAV